MSHNEIPVWEVEITVLGPVKSEPFQLNTRKDLEHPDPFYSNVKILHNQGGFKAIVTAFGPDAELAESAAILWFGRMLDFLSLKLNLPLQLDITNNTSTTNHNYRVKRIIDRNDFIYSFRESRIFSIEETTYLRALSWFRKGKYSQDPFDKFLALWNSIETIASKYNPNKDACKEKGSKCHIWECFKHVWGECEDWEFIKGQNEWIDQCNRIRKDIAHGIIPVEISSIELIMNKLPELENVSHKFISDYFEEVRPKMTIELFSKLK